MHATEEHVLELRDPPELLSQIAACEKWGRRKSAPTSAKFALWCERDIRIQDIGFVTYTKEEIKFLHALICGRQVLEIGAGTGYLARLLSDRGVKIRAIDNYKGPCTIGTWSVTPPYFNVERIDQKELESFDADIIMMVWPCMDSDFAAEVLRKMRPGQMLYYRGEGQNGCTASPAFFEELKYNFKFHHGMSEAVNGYICVDYDIYDRWSFYTKLDNQQE